MRLIPAALVLAFTIYCVVDVVRSNGSDVRGLPKPLWVVVVLLAPLAGGAAWLFAGRPRRSRLPGTARLNPPRPHVRGPDDDPDFLRTIDRPSPVAPAGPLRTGDGPGAAPIRDGTGASPPDGAGGTGTTGSTASPGTDGSAGTAGSDHANGTAGGSSDGPSGGTGGTDPTSATGSDDEPGQGAAAEADDRRP